MLSKPNHSEDMYHAISRFEHIEPLIEVSINNIRQTVKCCFLRGLMTLYLTLTILISDSMYPNKVARQFKQLYSINYLLT